MKKIASKTTWIIFLLVMLMDFTVNAQQRTPSQGRERIEAAKTAYLSRHIKLTSGEARQFWPVYDQYQEEMAQVRMNRKEVLHHEDSELESMSESEINALIDSRIAQAEKALAARKKMIESLRQFLPPIKIARFLRAEHQFNEELQQRLKNRKQTNF